MALTSLLTPKRGIGLVCAFLFGGASGVLICLLKQTREAEERKWNTEWPEDEVAYTYEEAIEKAKRKGDSGRVKLVGTEQKPDIFSYYDEKMRNRYDLLAKKYTPTGVETRASEPYSREELDKATDSLLETVESPEIPESPENAEAESPESPESSENVEAERPQKKVLTTFLTPITAMEYKYGEKYNDKLIVEYVVRPEDGYVDSGYSVELPPWEIDELETRMWNEDPLPGDVYFFRSEDNDRDIKVAVVMEDSE